MLQQIIKEMYIEPDLLAELSDEQKQLIFIKIREEQVRRWKEHEADPKNGKPPVKPTKKNHKHVNFLLGEDKNPWVWVMGEHPLDKSVDEIIEEEVRARAAEKAEREAAAVREKEEKEAERRLKEEEKRLEQERIEQEKRLEAIAAAKRKEADDVKKVSKDKEAFKIKQVSLKPVNQSEPVKLRRPPLCSRHSLESLAVPSSGNATAAPIASSLVVDTNINKTFEFDGEVFELTSPKQRCDTKTCQFCFEEKSEKARLIREESYRVLKEKRTSEIVSAFQKTKALWEQKANEDGKKLDQAWQQQERKAKQAETKLQILVKGAREDYRRNSQRKSGDGFLRGSRTSREVFRESVVLVNNVVRATSSTSKRQSRPTSKEAVVKWFTAEEKPKNVGLNAAGGVEPWFHGVISRDEAEALLSDTKEHSFLLRVSEKIWGYAISYKAEDRCKHYLVDTTDGGYQFFGTNQLEHSSLQQLLQYHKNHPISTAGQELLQFPVGQTKAPPDYAELLPELFENTSL